LLDELNGADDLHLEISISRQREVST